MTPRDLAVLDALRQDRDESGPGLSKRVVEEVGATRFADGLIVRLARQGYMIGVVGGLFQLGEETVSIEALSSGDRQTGVEAGLPVPVRDQAGDSASVDTDLTLFPSGRSPYETREAA